MSTDTPSSPASAAEFDQAHAAVRDSVDKLVSGLVMGQAQCTCGEAITSQQHTLVLVDYIRARYRPESLPLLLAEAVTRLAVAQGAK